MRPLLFGSGKSGSHREAVHGEEASMRPLLFGSGKIFIGDHKVWFGHASMRPLLFGSGKFPLDVLMFLDLALQ